MSATSRCSNARCSPKSTFNTAEYAYDVALANLKSAQVTLEMRTAESRLHQYLRPIDGVVVERDVDVGRTVAASLSAPQLFLIANDLSQMQILASVDESDIGAIHEGQSARFTVQAYPNETFTGSVKQVRLQSKTTENVVNYTVVVSVSNASGKLLPGMTATIDFLTGSAKDVLLGAQRRTALRPTEEMREQMRKSAARDGEIRRRNRESGERGSKRRRCGSTRSCGRSSTQPNDALVSRRPGQACCRARSNRAYGWATHRSEKRESQGGYADHHWGDADVTHHRSIESLPAATAADVTATAGRLLKVREPMAGEVIRVEGVTKVYRMGQNEVHALRGIDLKVESGEMLAVMGASGSGKSTLMNLLGCLDAPTSGEYFLDGVRVNGLGSNTLADLRNQKLGFIFQGFNLLARTTALENVELPLLYDRTGRRPRYTCTRGGGVGASRSGGTGRPSAERALGRSAATCRHRPRTRDRASAAPGR